MPTDRPQSLPPKVVIFDLGGVLVDFTGIAALAEHLPDRPGVEIARERWVQCSAVHLYEAGTEPCLQRFASAAVAELSLPWSADEFIDRFENWLAGPLDGAFQLLRDLQPMRSEGLVVVCLSNTNPLHADLMAEWLDAERHFDAWCLSYRMGHAKPAPDAFRSAQETVERLVSCAPQEIWFGDDSATNVEAARAFGWRASQVVGPAEARRALQHLGVFRG